MPGSESPLLWWYGFPIAFSLTCMIELPAYLGAFASLGWCRRGALTCGSALGLALAANLISHPLLWVLSLRLDETAHLVWAEVGVAVLEGLMIFAVVQRRRIGETRAGRLGWSLLCAVGVNTLSLLVGLVVLPRFIGL
jgi:hypothetical protein